MTELIGWVVAVIAIGVAIYERGRRAELAAVREAIAAIVAVEAVRKPKPIARQRPAPAPAQSPPLLEVNASRIPDPRTDDIAFDEFDYDIVGAIDEAIDDAVAPPDLRELKEGEEVEIELKRDLWSPAVVAYRPAKSRRGVYIVGVRPPMTDEIYDIELYRVRRSPR